MARAFSVEAESSRFRLPRRTREEILGLILDLDMDATDIIVRAVHELWQREIGEPERDLVTELDELRQRVARLEAES